LVGVRVDLGVDIFVGFDDHFPGFAGLFVIPDFFNGAEDAACLVDDGFTDETVVGIGGTHLWRIHKNQLSFCLNVGLLILVSGWLSGLIVFEVFLTCCLVNYLRGGLPQFGCSGAEDDEFEGY
jgi:hypothetical protein